MTTGIVGTGLIGTSIGLALRGRAVDVLLVDADPARARSAAALGAGQPGQLGDLDSCAHVVVAVPPRATPLVLGELLRHTRYPTVSDVCSVKANILTEVETQSTDASRYCGGHPIAGRERGGPGAARGDLFENSVWVITPTAATSSQAHADAAAVATACGARVVELSAREHDAVLAAVSHAPQLVASAVASVLPLGGPHAPQLAGTGFRDTTRLADSDPELWGEIAALNGAALAPVLRAVAARLEDVARALDAADGSAASGLVAAGRNERNRLPGKPSVTRPEWARVGVVVVDRPGELARLFAAAGAAGVNIEDLAIEHAPDAAAGFVDLAVAPAMADTLIASLESAGWHAHRSG